MAEMKPVTWPGLLGIRNRARGERLPAGALVAADNVDLDVTGTVERREGYTKALSLAECTSCYATRNGEWLYVVEAGVLSVIDPNWSKTVLAEGLDTGWLAWAEEWPMVFYAGEKSAGCIVAGLSHRPMRFPAFKLPKLQTLELDEKAPESKKPVTAGQYLMTAILRDLATGMESAAPLAVTQTVKEGERRYLLITPPDPVEGYEVLVYLTPANGPRLYALGTLAEPRELYQDDLEALAHPLHDEQYLGGALPENVTALAFHEGRLFAATYTPGDSVSAVFYSQLLWPTLYDYNRDWFQVAGRVCGLAATAEGLLVATDQALWLWTPEESLSLLARYGSVPGAPVTQDRAGRWYIWTVAGLVAFPPLELLTADKMQVPPGSVCATGVVERKGRKQVIILTDGNGKAFNVY